MRPDRCIIGCVIWERDLRHVVEDRLLESIHYNSCHSQPSSDFAYTRYSGISVTSKIDAIMHNLYLIFSAENLVWSIIFVTGMIFFLVLFFNSHYWLSSSKRPVSSSILSIHSATRAVSSAYYTSKSWSGIFLHSSSIFRFNCLKILSSTILKSVGDRRILVWNLSISWTYQTSAINSDSSRHNTVQCMQ